jgi:predicted CXXCH cytochrome family protein
VLKRTAHHALPPLVLAALVVALALPAVAFGAVSPHATYGPTTKWCGACHAPHLASTSEKLLSVETSVANVTESTLCYSCHDGSGSSTNVKNGMVNSFADVSGHEVENLGAGDPDADLTDACSDCHYPHRNWELYPRLPQGTVNGATVTGANTTWCLACHNDSNDWYTSTTSTPYPSLASPTRDAEGYPVLGTFPGSTAYNASNSGHKRIPSGMVIDPMVPSREATRAAGDCLWCHAAHRGKSDYDSLVSTFGPSAVSDQTTGDYAQSCFDCHGGDASWEATGAVDIKQFVTAASSRAGHRIKTSGGTLPVGAPLPCYDCHNPHGSKFGNTMLISDALGGSLDPTITVGAGAAAEVRQFCFTCHTTDDSAKGWDSDLNNDGTHDDGGYVLVTGQTIEGLARDAAVGANVLRLPSAQGHSESDIQACYNCHGRSYADGGQNVHNPTGGVSAGAEACYGCHTAYRAAMEYNGANRTSAYHHVMGDATTPGDDPFAASAYPGAGTDVYCLSCHVDHDKFNSPWDNAANLRQSATPGPATGADTDFNPSTNNSVCLGCHYLSRAKDTANQKGDGTAYTPGIPYASASAVAAGTVYNASAHQYPVTSVVFADTSTFKADCSKCHNDRQAKEFQTGSPSFGLHWDDARRILASLGRGPVPDPYDEERFCYSCHSVTGDGFKSTANRDWYGTAGSAMDAASQAIYGVITGSASKHTMTLSNTAHKPASVDEISGNRFAAGEHVECADCHSPHAAGNVNHTPATSGNNITSTSPIVGVWGVQPPTSANWTEPVVTNYTVQTASTKEYQICFKCHSSFNGSYSTATKTYSWTSATGWTNQALEFNTANESYHPVMGVARYPMAASRLLAPWNANPGAQTMYCSDCHMDSAASPTAVGPHGSSVDRLLKGTWNDGSTLDALSADFLCSKCHTLVNSNAPHSNNNHTGRQCTDCHLAIPHGGKVPRLLATQNTPAPYGVSPKLVQFHFPITQKGDCQALTGNQNCGNAHSSAPGTPVYAW